MRSLQNQFFENSDLSVKMEICFTAVSHVDRHNISKETIVSFTISNSFKQFWTVILVFPKDRLNLSIAYLSYGFFFLLVRGGVSHCIKLNNITLRQACFGRITYNNCQLGCQKCLLKYTLCWLYRQNVLITVQ